MMTELDHIQLMGRIAALEMLMRLTLTAIAGSRGAGNEVETLNDIERQTLSSLQFAQRGIGEFQDAVWEQMVDSLKEAFESARMRF